MNKRKIILLLTVLCIMTSVCWGQSYWKRTYEVPSANAITPTPDGNFIVAGNTILKITQYGDTLWTKTCRGTANAITSTPDGNFIVAGDTIIKITTNGDILWTKTYGGIAKAIIPTSDGNFIVAGTTNFFGAGYFDVYLLKIKPNGDTLWTKTYGGTENDGASAITSTSDGNFIVAGYTRSFGVLNVCVYLLKINTDGDTIWTKINGHDGNDEANAISETPEGNFIFAGFTDSFGAGNYDVYFFKLTSNGDMLWKKTYGGTGSDCAYSIMPTSDGNFIVAGYTEKAGYEAYFLKLTGNGDTLWTKTYGKSGNDGVGAIAPTSNGNFIAVGYTTRSDNFDLLLLSIIDDRYAKKDSLFTFKIPVSGDSLNHGYTALKAPSGMTVSLGGTISWIPKTDSVYMDHAEFLVFDDLGNNDTLTFNIFVNSTNKPTAIKPVAHFIANKNQSFSIMQTSSSQIKFNVPSGASSIDIYDINGRCVQRLKPVDAQAVWNGLSAAGRPVSSGRYFAKIKQGTSSRMGQFSVVK